MNASQKQAASRVGSDADALPDERENLAGVLGEVCAIARQGLALDGCAVTLIEDGGAAFRTLTASDGLQGSVWGEVGATCPLGDLPMAVEAAHRQTAWFCDDLNAEHLSPEAMGHFSKGPRICSACLAPMEVDDQAVGFVWGFRFDLPRPYDEDARRAFQAAGALAGMILKHARVGQDLARLGQRYRELVEISGDIVFTWRHDGEIVYASPAACRLCGAEDGMVGKDPIDWVHPDDRQQTREAWERWTVSAEPLAFRNRLVSRAGKEHRIQWRIHPVRDRTGRLTHIQGIGRDLAVGYELEEKLRAAQFSESIVRLSRGLAHKFNNMLVSVLGNASVLANQLEKNHPWRPIVDDIVQGAERAARLTRQLLTYARSTSHLPQRRRLGDLLAENLELGQTALPSKVSLEIHADAEDDWIETDPKQFQQVALNLVLNAAEAMPDGGEVTVRTGRASCALESGSPETECVALIVEDTGVGITPEDQERMFAPFFSTKDLGRGLGLAAVQGIVQAHRGKIEVESTPGEGTVVRVLFPTASPGG